MRGLKPAVRGMGCLKMMSLLALTGLVVCDLEGIADDQAHAGLGDDAYASEEDLDIWQHSEGETDLPDLLNSELDTAPDSVGGSETLSFERGDLVQGFDPRTDTLELEYTKALGVPEISLSEMPDGMGTLVAMNGVVVAELVGVKGLSAKKIVLIAV